MKAFLILSGSVSLIYGALSLISPDMFKKFSDACNRIILDIDKKIHRIRKPAGIVFLVSGIALLWFAFRLK